MRRIQTPFYLIVIILSLLSCTGISQDSPEDIVNVYAQSKCDMDIEGMASCYEYGEEMLEFLDMYVDEGANSLGNTQFMLSAADESGLLPEISYEIVEVNDDGEKGVVRVQYNFLYDDGEETYEDTKYEDVNVYCHDGVWWIGEGYTEKDREIQRRIMNFVDKVGAY